MLKNFFEVFDDVTKQAVKIPKSEYLIKGKFPIIDQGKEKVSGYSNSNEGLFTDVPAIIFGDHTRIIKYIDFPCFLGADGVKLIKAKERNANYKYLYYLLNSIRIPDTGYNRHFKWLKEAKLNLKSNIEQRQIVLILDRIEAIIGLNNRQLIKLNELIKSQFEVQIIIFFVLC